MIKFELSKSALPLKLNEFGNSAMTPSFGIKLRPQLKRDVIDLSENIVKNRHIARNAKQLKELSSTDLARHFQKTLMKDIEDWKDVLPKDGEIGAKCAYDKFLQYVEPVEKMKKDDAVHFAKCLFGTETTFVLKNSAKGNSAIQKFVETLETKIEGPLENLFL